MKIKITIEDKVFQAELEKDVCAGSYPQMLVFQRSQDHEYYGILNSGIDVKGLTSVCEVRRKGIYYFQDWKALSFVYNDADISPYEVAYLGCFEEDIADFLFRQKRKIQVGLEAAE